MALILVVEDDRSINELIVRNLKLAGHSHLQAFNGNGAVKAVAENSVDLILLDIGLPGMDGFEVIERIPPTSVIFITARGKLDDRLNGLSLGADDYIVKPFEMLELLARVEAVLRRTMKNATSFKLGGTTVDLISRSVAVNGEKIDLSTKEFELLEVLIKNRNIALSRENS
ncbi:MAG: response regulator transcription factor [Eubacterium sp.]|jgi:DNA-binding response OmpR family regulator|nr:response regulator transcription factor [Eubacterium sp.]